MEEIIVCPIYDESGNRLTECDETKGWIEWTDGEQDESGRWIQSGIYHPYTEEEKKAQLPTVNRNITAGEYVTVDGVLYLATANIPNGEPIIVGHNAVVTTLEEQLYKLTQEGE